MSASDERDVARDAGVVRDATVSVLRRRSLRLAEENPRLAHLLFLLADVLKKAKLRFSAEAHVAATDGSAIYVGPAFATLDATFKASVLMHEALHIVLGHPARSSLADDPALYNIIADLLVNTVLEAKLKARLPEGAVTLRTFADYVEARAGRRVSDAERAVIASVAEKYLAGEITTDDAYSILRRLEAFRDVAGVFGDDLLMGRDLSPGASGGAGSERPGTGGVGAESAEGGAGEGAEADVATLAEEGAALAEKLREARARLEDVLAEINRTLGSFQAMVGAGTEDATLEAEIERMRIVASSLEAAFASEVAEATGKFEHTFARFDEEAYWLPAEEERGSRVLALVDASGSVPLDHLKLFVNLVLETVEARGVTYAMSVFSNDEVAFYEVSENSRRARIKTAYGGGTVLGPKVAERIRSEVARGTRLVQIISDFDVIVTREAEQALREFASRGGVVACYSSTGRFHELCARRHTIPLSR